MPKFLVAVVAFIALCLKVIGEALVKDWSTMKPGRLFDSEEKKHRRALWTKRGRVFVKVGMGLLIAVAAWAVVSFSLNNQDSTEGRKVMNNWPWELIISIFGGAFFTAFFGWLFTRSTNKRFGDTMKALAGYLENKLAGNQVKFRRNKKGEPIGVSIVVIPEPIEVSSTPEKVLAVLKNEETGEKKTIA